MKWLYNETTECYTCDKFQSYRGAYGYKLIPYIEQWSIYFCNGWRPQGTPLGEYITRQGANSSVFATPIMGLGKELLFDSLEEAKSAALVHQKSGIEPEGYEFKLMCAVCKAESPAVDDEDEVLDAAQDAGWQVNGCNEDGLDLCPGCHNG